LLSFDISRLKNQIKPAAIAIIAPVRMPSIMMVFLNWAKE